MENVNEILMRNTKRIYAILIYSSLSILARTIVNAMLSMTFKNQWDLIVDIVGDI